MFSACQVDSWITQSQVFRVPSTCTFGAGARNGLHLYEFHNNEKFAFVFKNYKINLTVLIIINLTIKH